MRLGRIAVGFLFLLSCWFYWPDARLAASSAHSDASEYAIPAINFLRGEGFVYIVNGAKFPPNHMWGMAALLVPSYAVFGDYPGNGIYSVFICAVGTVVLTYFLARKVCGASTAFIACLFLLSADAFGWYSRIIATDAAPTAVFVLGACLLLLHILESEKPRLWKWILLGQLLGFGMALRSDSVCALVTVAILLVIHRKKLEAPAVAALVVSLSIWLGLFLATNWAYTGDPMRSMFQVTQSTNWDRVHGGTSWRYILNPTFYQSNLWRMLKGAPYQWGIVGGDRDAIKRALFALSWLLFALGVAFRRNRYLLLWTALLSFFYLLSFSCTFYMADIRSLLRVVPFLCIGNAAGVVFLWKQWPQWKSRLAILLLAGFGFGYLAANRYVDPDAREPIVDILRAADKLIPSNAVVVSSYNLWYTTHVLGATRSIVPLHPLIYGADNFAQWKKPPHPEWIDADVPDRTSQGTTVLYRRMSENGAQFIWQYAARYDESYLLAQYNDKRRIFCIGPLLYTVLDRETVKDISSGGWRPTNWLTASDFAAILHTSETNLNGASMGELVR